MLREETSSFTDEDVPSDASDMKNLASNSSRMRRPFNPVALRMIHVPGNRVVRSAMSLGATGADPFARRLVAELQQGGPETDMGLARWKVRLAFAPVEPVITASTPCLQS